MAIKVLGDTNLWTITCDADKCGVEWPEGKPRRVELATVSTAAGWAWQGTRHLCPSHRPPLDTDEEPTPAEPARKGRR